LGGAEPIRPPQAHIGSHRWKSRVEANDHLGVHAPA
jgi:hypothetical protein